MSFFRLVGAETAGHVHGKLGGRDVHSGGSRTQGGWFIGMREGGENKAEDEVFHGERKRCQLCQTLWRWMV